MTGDSIIVGEGKETTSCEFPLNSSTMGYVGNAAKSPSSSQMYRSSSHPIPTAYVRRSRCVYETAASCHDDERYCAASMGSAASPLCAGGRGCEVECCPCEGGRGGARRGEQMGTNHCLVVNDSMSCNNFILGIPRNFLVVAWCTKLHQVLM